MAYSSQAPASQEAAAGTPPSVGYFLLPRQLRKECQQVGINTLRLVLLIADATLGWDFSRWAVLSYRAIVADAGIPNDACVRRAIAEAVATALIEVQTTPAGILYALHRRYWVLAKVQPKWHLYKRVPYNPETDPLDESLSAIITIAQPLGETVSDNGSAITMIAEPLEMGASTPAGTITRIAQLFEPALAVNGSAIAVIAPNYHGDSELLSPREQAAITTIAQPLSEASPHLASHDAKEIKKEEKEIIKESRSDHFDAATEVDALAQRLADQQVLQSLLAERQFLQSLKPGQSGWGAAQRRLRAIAPEIARLQATCAPQTTEPSSAEPGTRSSESETTDGSRVAAEGQLTPLRGSQLVSASEDAADIVARRQRLLALQQELTQLKRTPSMQLLARQRIPRLEAAIKQLIASFEEPA